MAILKGYIIYFYSRKGSCITHLSVDGETKKRVMQLGKDMAKLLEEYYAALAWPLKISVKVEEYKPR